MEVDKELDKDVEDTRIEFLAHSALHSISHARETGSLQAMTLGSLLLK
jgi:hypothetical protein